jgi:hypothetical protein
MKSNRHIKKFNEHQENLNISDVRSDDNNIDPKKHAKQFFKDYFSGSGYSNQEDIINCMSDFANTMITLSQKSELNISDAMNSVITELYNELSDLDDTIKNIGSDNHEYYLGKTKGIESSIKIIEKHYNEDERSLNKSKVYKKVQ